MSELDEHTAEMYKAYQSGLTLAEVGEKFGVTRQSVYKRFNKRGLPLRSKQYQETVWFQGSTYSFSKGYYRKTDGDRSRMHRDVWEFYNGKIPDGYDIHHRDENKLNNDISNLECLPTPDHTRLHNPLQPIEVGKCCLHCGKTLERKHYEYGWETPSLFEKRKYCNATCAGKAHHVHRR